MNTGGGLSGVTITLTRRAVCPWGDTYEIAQDNATSAPQFSLSGDLGAPPPGGCVWEAWEIRATTPAGYTSVTSGPASFPGYPVTALFIEYPWAWPGTMPDNNFVFAPPTPTATPTPVPGNPRIRIVYPWLIWYGPRVGQPGQTIRGGGFFPAGFVQLHVWGPVDSNGDPATCGQERVYFLRADAAGEFTFTPFDAADLYLGTPCRGGWSVYGEDWTTGRFSNTETWTTSWFPVRRDR